MLQEQAAGFTGWTGKAGDKKQRCLYHLGFLQEISLTQISFAVFSVYDRRDFSLTNGVS